MGMLFLHPRMYVTEQPTFFNAVCELSTSMPPMELLQSLKRTEGQIGRGASKVRYGPRVIDLDIVLYGDRTVNYSGKDFPLILPHPRLAEREFVLRPLCDIDGSICVPGIDQSAERLLKKLGAENDVGQMSKVTPLRDGHYLEWGSRTLLMGIVNVTPDSFSDGGEFDTVERALEQVSRFSKAGFDVIDVSDKHNAMSTARHSATVL